MWGAAPLLFLALGRVGATAWEIVAQRATWSAPCAGILVLMAGQRREVARLLRSPRHVALLAISASAVGSGWALYVWSVNHGHNLDAALGYYINPLMNMAVGGLIFRERIGRVGMIAIGLLIVGVGLQAVAIRHLPLIALYLAFSFWVYGLIRKQIDAEAQAGLFVECLLIMAPGVACVLWLGHAGTGVFGKTMPNSLLMMLAGPVTVAPLVLFSWSARRLPLSLIGFLQFISPTMGFALGIALGEPLTSLRLASFVFIWLGILVFAGGAWWTSRLMANRRDPSDKGAINRT